MNQFNTPHPAHQSLENKTPVILHYTSAIANMFFPKLGAETCTEYSRCSITSSLWDYNRTSYSQAIMIPLYHLEAWLYPTCSLQSTLMYTVKSWAQAMIIAALTGYYLNMKITNLFLLGILFILQSSIHSNILLSILNVPIVWQTTEGLLKDQKYTIHWLALIYSVNTTWKMLNNLSNMIGYCQLPLNTCPLINAKKSETGSLRVCVRKRIIYRSAGTRRGSLE